MLCTTLLKMNYLKHISYPELSLNRAENRNQNRISPEKIDRLK